MDDESQMIDVLQTMYGFSNEDIRRLMQAGVLQGQKDPLQRDVELAESYMTAPTASGRGYAGIYRHANPLEHLGTLGSRVMGAYMRKQGRERQTGIEQQLAELRELYLRGGGAGAPRSTGYPAARATSYPLADAPAGLPSTGFRSTGHPGFLR